jgi:hypothetical protein
VLKFIDRNTVQSKLSQNGTADKKLFTQNTLSGLFTSLQSKVESSSKPKDIITNNYSYTTCWTYSIFYPDGSLTIANWQCVTELVITENPYYLLTSAYPINENGGGGGTGGGPSGVPPGKSEEEIIEETYQKEVDDYAVGAGEGGSQFS